MVIPAYRESERLPPFLGELCRQIESAGLPVRVRPVDDGSGKEEADRLRAVGEELREKFEVLDEPVFLDPNQGKGGAVYSGWDSAKQGEFAWFAFVDADGAVSPEETVRVLSELTPPAEGLRECIFAVRVRDEGHEVRRTPLRKFLGKIFRLLVRIIFRLPCRDTQCGLKCVPAEAYFEVRHLLEERRFAFDVELASRLVRAGCSIREIPISWEESPGTRLRFRSALQMLTALFAMRWRLFTKRGPKG